jgi:hypothetical protein
MDNRQLICTFSNPSSYKKVSDNIFQFYNIHNSKVFVFVNEKNDNELFLTYNIINKEVKIPKFPSTISIHRKKLTNTLYSLNALNKLIEEENNGVFDRTFIIQWELYKNSFIITGDISIRIIPIKIFDIIS